MKMKALLSSTFLLAFLLFFVASCKKDDAQPENGQLSISHAGKNYSAKYVDLPTPTSAGTFTFYYRKASYQGDRNKYQLLVRIDNRTSAEINVYLPFTPVVGTVYQTSGNNAVEFDLTVNDNDIDYDRAEVVFSKYSNPGQIAGTVKSYLNNKVIATATFDFIEK
jgi:hypothetical protein